MDDAAADRGHGILVVVGLVQRVGMELVLEVVFVGDG
jgi:hypothetical protein